MRDYRKDICSYIEMEKRVMDSLDTERINQVMNLLEETRERESVIYICGNGGSASTASHFVCDFNKGVSLEQDQKYNFVCLNDNVPNHWKTKSHHRICSSVFQEAEIAGT